MVKTAETLVEENKGVYRSIICHDDSDYSMSQLFELGTLAPKEVVELDADGAITPSMTTKEIREVVKDTKEMAKKANSTEEGEGEEVEIEEVEGELDLIDVDGFKASIYKALSELVSNNKDAFESLDKKTNKAISSLMALTAPITKGNN